VRRELGIHLELGRLLVVDWVAPKAGRIEGLLFVYDGGLLSAEQTETIVLPSDELREWAWCAEAQLAERLPSHMLGRTRSALKAQSRGSTYYAEDGLTVPA
jgi:hypothetical protein